MAIYAYFPYLSTSKRVWFYLLAVVPVANILITDFYFYARSVTASSSVLAGGGRKQCQPEDKVPLQNFPYAQGRQGRVCI